MKYLNFLRNKNLSNITIRTYLFWSNRWENYVKNKKENKSTFIKYIKENNCLLKQNSLRLLISATKQYLIFKKCKFIFEYIPIKIWKEVTIQKNIISDSLFYSWIKELDLNNFYDKRLWVILNILFFTGIRAFELLNIKNIDITENKILIRGKGQKIRYVYLDENIIKLIKNSNKFLITTKKGKRISQKQLNLIIRRFCNKINYKITPHDFRRSFCTNLIRKGCNLKVVQILMGHSNISVTSRYICLTEEDVILEYKKIIK